MAAARGIADIVADAELREDYIIPSVFNRDVAEPSPPPSPPRRSSPARPKPRASTRATRPAHPAFTPVRHEVAVTGATGLIGRARREVEQRGDDVTVLSRNPRRRASGSASRRSSGIRRRGRRRLDGHDAVVDLAGEPVGAAVGRGRETADPRVARRRDDGTSSPAPRGAAAAADARVGVGGRLLRARGDEPVDEDTPAGDDFLATVCVGWEQAARSAEEHGVRVVKIRTGIVLDKAGGALGKMLPPFKLGVGGPVAGGQQYMPWIDADDVVGLYLLALDKAASWARSTRPRQSR